MISARTDGAKRREVSLLKDDSLDVLFGRLEAQSDHSEQGKHRHPRENEVACQRMREIGDTTPTTPIHLPDRP